jgi:hypothetical protein
MSVVLDVLRSPTDMVLATLPPIVSPKKKCACFHSNTFSRVSQVASILFASIALISVVLMSTGVAPLSAETYGFCVVVFLLGAQNAISLQSKIELGGYDLQNKRFKAQNHRLSEEINRLVPIETGLRQTALGLETTLQESKAEVDRVKLAASALEADLGRVRDLVGVQTAQVEVLRSENQKLNELIQRQEAILNKFEEALTRQIATLGDKVSAIDLSVDRLELIETKFSLFIDLSLELKGQVDKLQKMQVGLQGILSSLTQGTDLEKIYLEKEELLQKEQEKIVQQFKELAIQEAAFGEREAELLKRLEEEVTRLKEIIHVHARKSEHLVLRVIPLKLQNLRFQSILEYVGTKNPELLEEAKQGMKRRRLTTLSS